MKYKDLFRKAAEFIISQLGKMFFKDDFIIIEHGNPDFKYSKHFKNISITKGSWVNILILPMPDAGKDYADCREYDPTKIIESFLKLNRSDKTMFRYGGGVIDEKYGMISVSANCVLVCND